jgi:hypothetical protein
LDYEDRWAWLKLRAWLVGAWLLFMGGYWVLQRIFHPAPRVVRSQVVQGPAGPVGVEVWLPGEPGDQLIRKTKSRGDGTGFYTTGVALMHENSSSADLPDTERTAAGTLRIVRYHLLVKGNEVDTLDVGR